MQRQDYLLQRLFCVHIIQGFSFKISEKNRLLNFTHIQCIQVPVPRLCRFGSSALRDLKSDVLLKARLNR